MSDNSFTIEIIDPCLDPSFTVMAGSIEDQTYILTDTALEVDLTSVFTTTISWCPRIYSFSSDNSEVDVAIVIDASNDPATFIISCSDDIGDLMETQPSMNYEANKVYQITMSASAGSVSDSTMF